MRVIRLLLAYDGTSFHGWQSQPGLRTVQGVLTEALGGVLGAAPALHAAGRTDAGVHARGQVVSFASESALPVRAIAPLTNRELPADVRIREATEAPPEFHARFSARARRYAYRLLDHEDILLGRFAWWPRRVADPARLEAATEVLRGEHDFSSFRSTGCSASSPSCHVTHASWSPWEGGVRLDIVADHFLYHMVRSIVGTVLEQATTANPAESMRAVLEARNRSAGGANAPPQGLTLEQVVYDEEDVCAHR